MPFADIEAAAKTIRQNVPCAPWTPIYALPPELEEYFEAVFDPTTRGLPVLQSRHSMKHKIIVVICLVAIVGLGSYATHHYDQYQNQKAHAAAVTRSTELKAQQEAATREAQFQAGVQMDEAQCARDTAAYNALTPAAKLKAPAPACEVNLIQ